MNQICTFLFDDKNIKRVPVKNPFLKNFLIFWLFYILIAFPLPATLVDILVAFPL